MQEEFQNNLRCSNNKISLSNSATYCSSCCEELVLEESGIATYKIFDLIAKEQN